jgi:protein-S-isoprenylcysteine O-methyltransferase Ste14
MINETRFKKQIIMDIKLIIIIAFSYLYGFFEIFMSLRQKSERTIVKSSDRGSIWVLIISISVGYAASFNIGATKIGRMNHWDVFFAIGAIMIIIGLIIRITSILTLKQHFTYTVAKIENHELIETGLYKIIRHPGYMGQLLIFTGTAATLSNWLSVVSMFFPVLVGYVYRISVEEKFMIEQMGQKYKDCQKRTKRLIPLIY